ncbi:MAG: SMC-Scp complex subunit ScpB [Deltaproteobacteria bacterium]|nr:SMC-Scp complex subunit ScpB [Deltaproteobacteria bacterium]
MSKSMKMIIEALLFSSDKPLSVKDIHDVLPDVEKTEIKNSIKILIHDYEALDRSFLLKEVAGGFQFRSRPEYGSYILRMFQKTPNRLSRATIETLAIIAYKQPILKSEIERLRGVDVGGIIKTLMEKGLVKIMGRKELPGRPLVYGTTKRFLEVFDLKDLNSLPKLKEIKDFAADHYEPTIMNRDASGEEGSEAGQGIIPYDQAEETAETGFETNQEQVEAVESEVESSPDTPEITEPEDKDYADEGLPGHGAEMDYEYSDMPEYIEDTREEDDPATDQDSSDPEESVDPEENGTET